MIIELAIVLAIDENSKIYLFGDEDWIDVQANHDGNVSGTIISENKVYEEKELKGKEIERFLEYLRSNYSQNDKLSFHLKFFDETGKFDKKHSQSKEKQRTRKKMGENQELIVYLFLEVDGEMSPINMKIFENLCTSLGFEDKIPVIEKLGIKLSEKVSNLKKCKTLTLGSVTEIELNNNNYINQVKIIFDIGGVPEGIKIQSDNITCSISFGSGVKFVMSTIPVEEEEEEKRNEESSEDGFFEG